nr:abortive infection family protein [Halanaerobacter jeridensis]
MTYEIQGSKNRLQSVFRRRREASGRYMTFSFFVKRGDNYFNFKKCKKIKKLIKRFRKLELSSFSADPDEKTASLYAFKNLIKNILYYKDYIKDDFLRKKMNNINLDFDNISGAYEVKGEMIPLIDDIEEYVEDTEKILNTDTNNKNWELNFSKLERMNIISEIAHTLQERMTTREINIFLNGFNLDFEEKEMANSKRVYVEEILSNVSEDIVVDIANELDIEINQYDDLEVEKINKLNFNYINDQIDKCRNKLKDKDYDGAITNARTLVESVCYYILEDSGKEISNKGDLIKLYKTVSDLLQMDPSIYNEDFLKQISSGFFSIINGIASLRNELSDAHGRSKDNYYKPEYRHAMLAVNSAKTISEFLYSSWENRNIKQDKCE